MVVTRQGPVDHGALTSEVVMVVAKVVTLFLPGFCFRFFYSFPSEWIDNCARVVDSLRLKLSGPLVFRAQIPKAILENHFGKMKYTGFGGAGQFFDFLVFKIDPDPICKVQRSLPTSIVSLNGKYKWVRFKLTLRRPMFLMLMFPLALKQILFSSNRNINIGSSN